MKEPEQAENTVSNRDTDVAVQARPSLLTRSCGKLLAIIRYNDELSVQLSGNVGNATTGELLARFMASMTWGSRKAKKVEWREMEALPDYQPGSRYLMLAAGDHHPCTEIEKTYAEEKRWFRSDMDGTMHLMDFIEGWVPIPADDTARA
ncbi:hypothetical protein ACYSUW_14270 [Pseudomonas frederiksbergensis]